MNTINLIGRLTKETELNQTGKTTFLRNSIAVKRPFAKDKTDFFNIVAFGKTAEVLAEYCDKGTQLGVVGRMESTSKDGKVYWDVVVENITLLDKASTNNNTSTKQTIDDSGVYDDDEFPF